MNKELEKAANKPQASIQPYTKERTAFKTLLLTNSNYFGNLPNSSLKPVLKLLSNTYYEELACVGYHPQQEQLEAVIYINQSSGYGTDICGAGTPEYVRFYLSFDKGVTWQDQGMTSFQAFDIPEGTQRGKRLEYAVSLLIDPKRKLCWFGPQLILARAILSWNNPPPANQPNWSPVWGNIRESEILVEPRRIIFLPEIFELADVKLPPLLSETFDLDMPIQTKEKALNGAELAVKYRNEDIPVHRFAFKEISAFVSAKTNLSAELFAEVLPGIKFDPGITDLIFPKTDGDKSYEELKCIGLDPNTPDTLVGVIQVKKSSGYSGGLCTNGSLEHVTFWADFDGNGTFETCLGTASVRVYDLPSISQNGVYFAVRLPVDLSPYRQRCNDGPVLVRIRAILSWNTAVPCSSPNKVPAWGNREETLINIPPSAQAPAGKIAILGGIPVVYIDDVTGLTTPDAVFATNNLPPDNPDGNLLTSDARPCPFAARVSVQGAPLMGYSYKVEVTPASGGAPTAVVTNLVLVRQNGTVHIHKADPATLRFDYVNFNDNINSLMAQWNSAGDELWVVKLTTFNGAASNPLAPAVGVDTHLIQLDNTPPQVNIDITIGPGNCGKFGIGTLLSGNFVARDDYLGHYGLGVEPAVNIPPVGIPSPSSGIINTALPPGNGWTLDTKNMKPCGYIIRVVAVDRAIVNSQSVGHWSSDSAGFCLE